MLWQLVGGYLSEPFIAQFLPLKRDETIFFSYLYVCKSIQLLSHVCQRWWWWWWQQWWWEDCKMQKISSKDLPGSPPSLSASHLLWKSKNFAWICVKRWERLHVKCRFLVFCIRALPTTNDSWSNHEGLDPLSYRCVYWIMRIQGWWGVEGSVSASRSIFGFFFFFFRQAQSLRNLDGNILRSFFRTIS